MIKPLSQKQFNHYYLQTDPAEPKPVREVHAIRMALAARNKRREQAVFTFPMIQDFIQKYNIKNIKYAC